MTQLPGYCYVGKVCRLRSHVLQPLEKHHHLGKVRGQEQGVDSVGQAAAPVDVSPHNLQSLTQDAYTIIQIPDTAIITPAKVADRTQMNELVIEEKDAFNVFDRAYLDYKLFDSYCENGIPFVLQLILPSE